MLKSLRFSREYIWDKVFVVREHNKTAICCVFSGTHRQDDVSNVDAPILIDSAAFHYALHYHTSAVDWGKQDKFKESIDCVNAALNPHTINNASYWGGIIHNFVISPVCFHWVSLE